jgi:protein subunit release factor B
MTTHLLQISSGSGPIEVRRFVARLADALADALQERGLPVVASLHHGEAEAPRSIGLIVEHPNPQLADLLGTHCLISAERGRRARKRWFAGVTLHTLSSDPPPIDPADLLFSACRAGGPGGQHVQTSSTAVRVLHVPTGLSVRAEDERSQLANRKAALRRLEQVLAQREEERRADGMREAWRAHQALQRGEPVAVWDYSSRPAPKTSTAKSMNARIFGTRWRPGTQSA